MRKIYEIADDIRKDWKNINPAAQAYLYAMFKLSTINDMYGCDDARSIILYFLANANTWKGEKAREIKQELKSILNEKSER